MRREFLVERQGRQFVLYAGLLALGHENGLKSITTQLVQIPTENNQRVAIVSAVVVLERDGNQREFHGIGDASPNNVASAMVTCLIRLAETRAKARALRDAVNVGVAALEELGDDDVFEGAPERGYAMSNNRPGRALASRAMASNRSNSGGGGYSGNTSPRASSNVAIREASPGNGRQTLNSAIEQDTGTTGGRSGPNAASTEGKVSLTHPVTEAQLDAIRSLCRRRNLDGERTAKERFGVETLNGLTQSQASDLIKVLQVESASNRLVSPAA